MPGNESLAYQTHALHWELCLKISCTTCLHEAQRLLGCNDQKGIAQLFPSNRNYHVYALIRGVISVGSFFSSFHLFCNFSKVLSYKPPWSLPSSPIDQLCVNLFSPRGNPPAFAKSASWSMERPLICKQDMSFILYNFSPVSSQAKIQLILELASQVVESKGNQSGTSVQHTELGCMLPAPDVGLEINVKWVQSMEHF